jgi:hypothetical protein
MGTSCNPSPCSSLRKECPPTKLAPTAPRGQIPPGRRLSPYWRDGVRGSSSTRIRAVAHSSMDEGRDKARTRSSWIRDRNRTSRIRSEFRSDPLGYSLRRFRHASNARAHRPGRATRAQVRCSALFGDSLRPPIRSQFCPNKPYRLFLVEEVPVVEKPAPGGFNQGFVYGAWTPNQPAVFTPQTVCG